MSELDDIFNMLMNRHFPLQTTLTPSKKARELSLASHR